MIILDTNVLSELVRPLADDAVVVWLDQQRRTELVTTVITKAELAYGLAQMPEGKRKGELSDLIAAVLARLAAVLPFEGDDAHHYGKIMADCRRLGRPVAPLDAQIAAIARSNHASVATRNVRHFMDAGVELIDPWSA